MTHQDFTPTPDTLAYTQKAKNELARRAASLAWQISNELPNPADWKARIDAAPPEVRECLRELLVQKFRALQDRRRREQGGKHSAVAEQELAKIGEIAGRE